MAKHNWAAIKETFVLGHEVDGARVWPNQSQLSVMFGVSRAHLSRRCNAEGWEQQRQEFRTGVTRERHNQTAQAIANAQVTVEISAARTAARLLEEVNRHISEAQEKKQPIPPGTVHILARATAVCQGIVSLENGLPTSIEERRVLDANAEVRRWRPIAERMTKAELEAAMRGIAPIKRIQSEIEREAQAERDSKLH